MGWDDVWGEVWGGSWSGDASAPPVDPGVDLGSVVLSVLATERWSSVVVNLPTGVSVLSIASGNLLPTLTMTLQEDGEAFVILVDDVVTMTWYDGAGTRRQKLLDVVSAEGGVVRATWVDGETLTPGGCFGQIDVIRVGEDAPRTFPNTGSYVEWMITRHL